MRRLALLAGVLLLGAGPASAQLAPEPPGTAPAGESAPSAAAPSDGPGALVTRAQGHALAAQFILSRPNTVPFDPLLDIAVGLATGALDEQTGQSTATASVLYPGDVLSNPAAFVPLIGFPVGGQLLPPDHPITTAYFALPTVIPPYPLVTRASFPGQPGKRVDALGDVVNQVPLGLPVDALAAVQESSAAEDFASAKTTGARVSLAGIPGVLPVPEVAAAITTLNRFIAPFVGDAPGLSGSLAELAGIESAFEAGDDGSSGAVSASATIAEVQFAGGLVRLGPVRAVASQTVAPGRRTVRSHLVDVGSIRVLGIEVRVSDDGVTVVDQRIPAGAAGTVSDQLNAALDAAGVRIAPPSRTAEGDSLAAQALTLSLAFSNPTIPGLLPAGDGMLTLRLADVLAALDVAAGAPGAGSGSAGGDLSSGAGFDVGSGTLDLDAGGSGLGGPAAGAGAGGAGGGAGSGAGAPAGGLTPIATTRIGDRLQDLTTAVLAFTLTGLGGALWGWRRRYGRVLLREYGSTS